MQVRIRNLFRIIFTSIVLLSSSLFAYSSEFKVYKNTTYNLTINYPKGWKVYSPSEVKHKTKGLLSPSKNTISIIANPNDYDQNVNIQIIEGVNTSNLTDAQIGEIANSMDRSYAQQIGSFVKISHKSITVDKNKALEYTFKAPRNNVQIQQKQITIIKNGKAYMITCTAKEDEFNAIDKECFRPLIDSIRL